MTLWPSMAFLLATDLAWIVTHAAAIRRAGNHGHLKAPVLAWPDGRVRIEFVGTYTSAAECRCCWEKVLPVLSGETTHGGGA